MNQKIKKFLSKKSNLAFIQGHPGLFPAEEASETWDMMLRYLKAWEAEGRLLDEIITFPEFVYFLDTILLFAHKDELKALHTLFKNHSRESDSTDWTLINSLLEKYQARIDENPSPLPEGVKVDRNLLALHSEKVASRLKSLKEARAKGKEGLKKLQNIGKSFANKKLSKAKVEKHKKKFALLGEKVLKTCKMICNRTKEKICVDEISSVCIEVGNLLMIEMIQTQQDLPELDRVIKKIPEGASHMKSLRENIKEIFLKMAHEEERFQKLRGQIEGKKEVYGQYIAKLEQFKNQIAERKKELRRIDGKLANISGHPNTLPLCKELIYKTREALSSNQSNLRSLAVEYEPIKEEQKIQLESYEKFLEKRLDLQDSQSSSLNHLEKIIAGQRSKVHSAHLESIKTLLSLTTNKLALDRFIVKSPKLAGGLSLGMDSVKKMMVYLKSMEKSFLQWEGFQRKAREKTATFDPVKKETLLEALRNDFRKCSSLHPLKEEITILFKRSYEQEKKANEYELDSISRIISDDSPVIMASTAEARKESPLRAILWQVKGKRSRGMMKLMKWHKRGKRWWDKDRKMEYSESRSALYLKRAFPVLLAMGAFVYFTQNPAFKVDARIVDQLNYKNSLEQSIEEDFPIDAMDWNKEIETAVYSGVKMEASSDFLQAEKERWKIFFPIFENRSDLWDHENRPILLNKSGHIPNWQELENFVLLEKIGERLDSQYGVFFTRMYLDFVELEIPHKKAAKLIIANENIDMDLPHGGVEVRYRGQNRPILSLEKMSFDEFVNTMTPFIVDKYTAFAKNLRHKIPENLPSYARMLAEDIYFSANAFGIPVTTMISIAHQETYFMNIRGDRGKSVGPFQIYDPTRRLTAKQMKEAGLKIPKNLEHLENQITLCVYMAAFHIKTLIKRYASYTKNPKNGEVKRVTVDLDKCLKSYNGASSYPFKVLKKRLTLRRYLREQKKAARV